MNSYKKSMLIIGTITVLFFIAALLLEWHMDRASINFMSGHRAFIVNLLIGVCTGGFMAVVSSAILYSSLKDKTRVKTYYRLSQFIDKIKTFNLCLGLASIEAIDGKNVVITSAYQSIYELSAIFIELSLDEANALCGDAAFNIMGGIVATTNELGLNMYKFPSKTNELLKAYSLDVNPRIKKLEILIKNMKINLPISSINPTE